MLTVYKVAIIFSVTRDCPVRPFQLYPSQLGRNEMRSQDRLYLSYSYCYYWCLYYC